jgi:phosphoglycolate phosphatase
VVTERTHVLLDLDGTLADSEPGIMASLKWAFVEEGFEPPTDDEARSVIGPPLELGLPSIGIPDDALGRVIARYRERYEDSGLYEVTTYDGVVEMLEALRDRGYILAIATAKPQHSATRVVEHLGLDQYFDVLAGATLTSERRLKAHIIGYALTQLKVPTELPDLGDHVIMVGDREHDVAGAMRHRIPCIGVTWGYGSETELLTAGAVALAEHPERVADLAIGTYRLGEQR